MASLNDLRDKNRRTVLVHAIVREGRLVNFYTGKELPEWSEGAMVDIRVQESDFKDPEQCKAFAIERSVMLFNKGMCLFVVLNPDRIRQEDLKRLTEQHVHPWNGPPSLGAFVHLEGELQMRLSGSKKGSLSDVKCKVPMLGDAEVRSLNHAYTLLSKEFEVKRRSFGGNVFEVAFVDTGKSWTALEKIRDEVMAEHEREIMTSLGIEDVDGRISEIRKR